MQRPHFTTGISIFVFLTCALAVSAQDTARTVQYHAQDIIPIRAKVKFTTLIELPATEKIMEAATGDKDFWIVDVVGNFCFVHPAKAGISSNLNLITDKGNIYSFTLQDVSAAATGRAGRPEGAGRAGRSVRADCLQRSSTICTGGPIGPIAGGACRTASAHDANR